MVVLTLNVERSKNPVLSEAVNVDTAQKTATCPRCQVDSLRKSDVGVDICFFIFNVGERQIDVNTCRKITRLLGKNSCVCEKHHWGPTKDQINIKKTLQRLH